MACQSMCMHNHFASSLQKHCTQHARTLCDNNVTCMYTYSGELGCVQAKNISSSGVVKNLDSPSTACTSPSNGIETSVVAILSIGSSTTGSQHSCRSIISSNGATSPLPTPPTPAAGMLQPPQQTTTTRAQPCDITRIYRRGWAGKRQPYIEATISTLGIE
jgi:hypothetical protein